MDAGLAPELSLGAQDALAVEGPGDVRHSAAGLGKVEDALDDARGIRVGLQGGALLRPVLHHHPVVAEGGVAGDPEAARGRLAHPPRDLLGEILAVELVHALDDGLHELAGGGVVGVLGDGDDSNALAPEHGLESDGVLPLAGEAGELPDQNLPERSVGLGGCVDHLAELRAVGDAPALGLIHVLAEDDVAVLLCVVPERPQLGGDGQVHVLAVTGDSGVEGHGRVVGVLVHGCVLLVHSWSVWRERRICIRSCLRHALSSK